MEWLAFVLAKMNLLSLFWAIWANSIVSLLLWLIHWIHACVEHATPNSDTHHIIHMECTLHWSMTHSLNGGQFLVHGAVCQCDTWDMAVWIIGVDNACPILDVTCVACTLWLWWTTCLNVPIHQWCWCIGIFSHLFWGKYCDTIDANTWMIGILLLEHVWLLHGPFGLIIAIGFMGMRSFNCSREHTVIACDMMYVVGLLVRVHLSRPISKVGWHLLPPTHLDKIWVAMRVTSCGYLWRPLRWYTVNNCEGGYKEAMGVQSICSPCVLFLPKRWHKITHTSRTTIMSGVNGGYTVLNTVVEDSGSVDIVLICLRCANKRYIWCAMLSGRMLVSVTLSLISMHLMCWGGLLNLSPIWWMAPDGCWVNGTRWTCFAFLQTIFIQWGLRCMSANGCKALTAKWECWIYTVRLL